MTITTEEVRQIDVHYMKQRGFLEPRVSGVLRWHCEDEETGSVDLSAADSCLTLVYWYCYSGAGWVSHRQEITIDRTRCHFGGTRPWFRCPGCARRVGVLYGVPIDHLCRHCYGLSYGSQRERELDQILRRAREIRKRLGASDDLTEPVYEKPKGMHWRTFQQLVAEQNSLIASYDYGVSLQYGP